MSDHDVAVCSGDSVAEAGACDGDGLDGAWCASLGYDGGNLACAADRRSFEVAR